MAISCSASISPASTIDAARERAEALVDGHAIELWQLDRKIATFEPDPLKTEKASGWLKGELQPPE